MRYCNNIHTSISVEAFFVSEELVRVESFVCSTRSASSLMQIASVCCRLSSLDECKKALTTSRATATALDYFELVLSPLATRKMEKAFRIREHDDTNNNSSYYYNQAFLCCIYFELFFLITRRVHRKGERDYFLMCFVFSAAFVGGEYEAIKINKKAFQEAFQCS